MACIVTPVCGGGLTAKNQKMSTKTTKKQQK
jgi:hypothetical protein